MRGQVSMVQSLAHEYAGILLHVVGGFDVFMVYFVGSKWRCKVLTLDITIGDHIVSAPALQLVTSWYSQWQI